MDDIDRCYEVLELDKGAPLEQIENAYRELTKVWHPDRFAHENPSLQQKAEGKQSQINEAYEQLRAHVADQLSLPFAADRSDAEMQVRPKESLESVAPPAKTPMARIGKFLSAQVAPVLVDTIVPALMRYLTSQKGVDGPSQSRRRQQEGRRCDGSGGGHRPRGGKGRGRQGRRR